MRAMSFLPEGQVLMKIDWYTLYHPFHDNGRASLERLVAEMGWDLPAPLEIEIGEQSAQAE